jgi:hypothetical protein
VVLVNCGLADAKDDVLDKLFAKGISSPMPLGTRRLSDSTAVWVDPGAPVSHAVDGGDLIVRRMDLETVRVVANVVASSVALHYLEHETDDFHGAMDALNKRIEAGDISRLPRQEIVRLLIRSSRVRDLLTLAHFSDAYVVTGRGRGFRSRIACSRALFCVRSPRPGSHAWMTDKYYKMYEDFSSEFELEERREDLEDRLRYASAVLKFCLEQKGEHTILRLDMLIVFLLTIELAIAANSLWKHWYGEERALHAALADPSSSIRPRA